METTSPKAEVRLDPGVEKQCSACREVKHVYEFFRHKGRADGFEERCKTCVLAKRDRARDRLNQRIWRAQNPERAKELARASSQRRRARRLLVHDERIDYGALLAKYGKNCYLCGHDIPQHELVFDHVTPLALGGRHAASNLRPAHALCNGRKGAKLLHELKLPFERAS